MEQLKLEDPLTYTYLKPNKKAYLYFPKEQEQYIGEGKKLMRLFFDGPITMTQFEKDEYEKFEKQLKDSGDEQKHLQDQQVWTKPNRMRFLQASGWKYNVAINNISQHNDWRKNNLPIKLDEEIIQFLQSGIIYLHGRDNRNRPIMVLNAYKIDTKKMSEDSLIKGVSFFLEVVVNNMLLPGQIENWVIILDFNQMGLFSFPVMSFKKMIGFLQSNYRARMYKLYCVNTPNSIWVPWKAVQLFLEENTIQKVNFSKQNTPTDLFKHCNKSQVESKFGGSAPDLQEFSWPPKIVQGETCAEGEKENDFLITVEEYKKKYLNKELSGCEICQEYIK
ncbi:hypothetical protein ABPG74_013960 [Tetrahymena malaccensis]